MYHYFEEEVLSRSEYEHVRGKWCVSSRVHLVVAKPMSLFSDLHLVMTFPSKNDHELCAFWTSVGECETNRGFMLDNCPAACRLCLLSNTNMMA